MEQDRLNQSIGWSLRLTLLTITSQYLFALLLLIPPPVNAQQLSMRHYDVADGLAHSHVGAIHQDRKGYIWFGTWEGLSRFDGYRFTNYGVRDGLGHTIVNAIVEDRQGHIWVATNGGGVSRLIDDPREDSSFHSSPSPPLNNAMRQKFISYRVGNTTGSNRVNSLIFDAKDNLWCTTDVGLYVAVIGHRSEIKFNPAALRQSVTVDMPAFTDRTGTLWFGISDELIEVVNGRIIRHRRNDKSSRYNIVGVCEDQKGRLLVINEREAFEFIAPNDVQGRGRWQPMPLNLTSTQTITAIKLDTKGTLWIGTGTGLIKYRDGKQTLYTTVNGLRNNVIRSLTEDRDGNLWIGTELGGVYKFSGDLITTIASTKGLPYQNAFRIIEDPSGRIYASIINVGLVEIINGKAVPVPGSTQEKFIPSIPYLDTRGKWWLNTFKGLYRVDGAELNLFRTRRFQGGDGIPSNKINVTPTVVESQTGKLLLWYSSDQSLFRLTQSQNENPGFERIHLNTALPFSVIRIMSDSSGALWFSGHEALTRWQNGKAVFIQPSEGLPEIRPRFFFQDSRGWLWVGLRFKGVSVSKDPNADSLKFVNYSTSTGLISDTVWTIAEDNRGRIYLGTSKGLDQLDPVTGHVRHFNSRDGLAGDLISYCLKDRNGNIWIATTLGLSMFNPNAERVLNPPPKTYLSRVQIAGENLPIAETGVQRIPDIKLYATSNNLLIEYVALSFHGEQRLRYQYKLEGVDTDWSTPAEERSVNYARLAPGSYRFLARAINQEGSASLEPAVFEFSIMPPIWRRWWFLSLTAIVIGLVGYALNQYRITHILKMERMRTGIATDLHDDIGSNLTRISILSEVAQLQDASNISSTNRWLMSIAEIARESVSSINDIVWAINPNNDRFMDLIGKMRQHAEEIFTLRDIKVKFTVPRGNRDFRIDVNVRRDLYLIFKETVNNAARHSGCSDITIDLNVEDRQLTLTIHDNGHGFDPMARTEGNGLQNIRRRAAALGGKLSIESQISKGMRLRLTILLTCSPISSPAQIDR